MGVLDNQYVSKLFFVDGMFTSLTLPRDLWARQPSRQWSSRDLGVVFVNFFSPPFFVLKIDPVSDGFLDRFWTGNGPQINQKSIKTCFFSLLFLRCVFSSFFCDFCSIFEVSEPEKSCSRLHASTIFEKSPFSFSDLFSDGFYLILASFSTPKRSKMGSGTLSRKKSIFGTYFIDFLVDLGAHLASFGRPF